MLKKRKIIIFLLGIVIILTIVFIQLFCTNNFIFRNYAGKKIEKFNMEESSQPNFVLKSYEKDNVLLTFYNSLGIKQIEYPDGMILYCKGKPSVATDYKVEANQTYEFKVTDTSDHVTTESFSTPEAHIEICQNEVDANIEDMQQNISDGLNKNLIATNFIDLHAGELNYINSEDAINLQEAVNSWKKIGADTWSVTNDGKIYSRVPRRKD